jgi:hypothetical protein
VYLLTGEEYPLQLKVTPIDFVQVFKRDFGFDLSIEGPRGNNLLPQLFRTLYPRLDKIRVISNCVKHQGGIPTHEQNAALFDHLPDLPERRKLAIDHEEFLQDFKYVLQFTAQFMNFYDDLMEYVLLQRELSANQDDLAASKERFAALKIQLAGMATMFKEGEFGNTVTMIQDFVDREQTRELHATISKPHGPHGNDVRPEEITGYVADNSLIID